MGTATPIEVLPLSAPLESPIIIPFFTGFFILRLRAGSLSTGVRGVPLSSPATLRETGGVLFPLRPSLRYLFFFWTKAFLQMLPTSLFFRDEDGQAR